MESFCQLPMSNLKTFYWYKKSMKLVIKLIIGNIKFIDLSNFVHESSGECSNLVQSNKKL